MLAKVKQILFGPRSNIFRGGSSQSARSRLHFVLVQDRTGLSSDEMAKFKEEMIGVIEKYFSIDKNTFDIAYKRDSDTTTLLINSPVVVKRSVSKKENIKKNKGDKNNAPQLDDVDAPATPA